MDKTYAETQGIAPFDWNLFLANPPAEHSKQHESATVLAKAWVTCACGNQCAIIPRNINHAPYDDELLSLGVHFVGTISWARWKDARTTLAAIEARSTVLIREELAKLTP